MGSSYGTFTITDVSDGIPGPQGPQGEPGAAGAQGVGVERTVTEYYLQEQGESAPTSASEGSLALPQFIDGSTYWIRTVTYLDDDSVVIGDWVQDDGLTQEAQQNYDNTVATTTLQTNLRYIWTNFIQPPPAGTYMVAGNSQPFTRGDASTYGFNSFIDNTQLAFRYNDINLTTIGNTGISLYTPLFNEQTGEINRSIKRLGITNNAMSFYNSSGNVLADYSNTGIKFYDGINSDPNLQIASNRITIGPVGTLHMEIDPNMLGFYNGYNLDEGLTPEEKEQIRNNARVSFINNNKLYIPYSVVLNEMIVGEDDQGQQLWAWRVVAGTQHLRLVWLGGDRS